MMNLDFLQKKIFQVDGLTITVGVILAAVIVIWLLRR